MELVVGVKIIVVCALALVILEENVDASPLVIRKGISQDKTEQDDEAYLHNRQQEGVAIRLAGDTYNVNNERKFITSKDAGKYNVENKDQQNHRDEGSFHDEAFHRKNADSIANIDKKIGHHKGHRKSGFHNTYRKEESGNNSSYYDDSADDGDEYVHDSRKQSLGDVGDRKQYQTHGDGAHRYKENAKRGDYEDSGTYVRDNQNKKGFNQGKYYNERTDDGKRTSGYDYDLSDRVHQQDEKHYRPAVKYYPTNYYQAPKRTITIYEDPRVLQPDYSDRFYKRSNPYYSSSRDPVTLDFRVRPPSDTRNYYYDNRRPIYDYDYYNY